MLRIHDHDKWEGRIEEFLAANEDLMPEEIHDLNVLDIGESFYMSVHAGYMQIERIA